MECNSGSNRASNFKLAERLARGRFEITSTIIPELYDTKSSYAPINSKLQHPPPWAYPGHLTVHCARGGGEFERCVGRVGNLNRIYLLFWSNTPVSFFRFLQGLTDLQDRISPLLVNNSFKRVFKRSLKVSLRHISLWKECEVFDWRRSLSLRRGSSVLIGGAFERLFGP